MRMADTPSVRGPLILVQDTPCLALKIPNEILNEIAKYLSIADINSLTRTCHGMAISLQPILLRRDIQSKQYNSLFWACYSGCPKLASACLSLGASPNAAFCKTVPSNHPQFLKNSLHDDHTMSINKDHLYFKIIVCPSKRFHCKGLLRHTACSALALATERDHLEVIQILLKFGADTLEKHHKLDNLQSYIGLEDDPHRFLHHSVISRVCSVPAAKILLEAGAKAHINNLSPTSLTPLEMILYCWSFETREDGSKNTETELYSLIRVLLENGASPRSMSTTRLFQRYHDYQSSPLLATIPLRCLSVFRLILESGPKSMMDDQTGWLNVLYIALGCKPLLDSPMKNLERPKYIIGRQWKQKELTFRNELLVALLKAGLSPSRRLEWGGGTQSLLVTALSNSFHKGIETLMAWKADSTPSSAKRMSAISQAVFLTSLSKVGPPGASDYFHHNKICPEINWLAALGASINKPSFSPQGFPPLLFAACDQIKANAFETLLRLGAKADGFYQLLPNRPFTSLLQCLFRGRLALRAERRTIDISGYRLSEFGRTLSTINASYAWPTEIKTRQSEKFDAYIRKPVGQSLFRTSDGKHILNWAVEELKCSELSLAVDKLLPYYADTKLSSSLEDSPLLALFSQSRRENYLAFGILHDTFRIVQAMVNSGVSACAEVDGETVLHRVCKLNPGIGSYDEFERIIKSESDTQFEYDEGFLQGLENRCRAYSCIWRVRYNDICASDYYESHRYVNMYNIVWFLIRNGADSAAQDKTGKTPFDYAEENQFNVWQNC